MKKIFFLKGRTALKYGLKYLGLKKKDKILIPSIICDVVIEEIKKLHIKPIYYYVDNKFNANWQDINKKYSTQIKAILMVNFFGVPQKISLFKKFCNKKNLYLIEDNCHGFNGDNNMKMLADIRITSPYKIIKKIKHGGLLTINKNFRLHTDELNELNLYKESFFNKIVYIIKKIDFVKKIYRFVYTRPNYEAISINNKYELIQDTLLDSDTRNLINNFSLIKEKTSRIKNFNKWKKFLYKFNIKPYFNYSQKNDYILWYFVAKIDDPLTRKKFYDWGWNNNIDIISWPSFPKEYLGSNLDYKFSRKFVLFPLNVNLKNINKSEKFKN